MTAIAKGLVERALVESGIAAIARISRRFRTLIVVYHDVVPEGDDCQGDASLHLPQRRFASQLDALRGMGDVVGLSTIDMDGRSRPPLARPRFVVTFDDAYLGALTAGISELRKRGMPATVFVAPGLLGETPWWDLLADPKTGVLDVQMRNHALSMLNGRRDPVLQWAGDRTATNLRRNRPVIASRAELHSALAYEALTVGSHTWSHPNLTTLDQEDLDHELSAAAEWLRAEFPMRYIPWLTYPYGLVNADVKRAAMTAGYTAALKVDGGWMNRRYEIDRFELPRLNIPRGVSEAGFTLRLSGIGGR